MTVTDVLQFVTFQQDWGPYTFRVIRLFYLTVKHDQCSQSVIRDRMVSSLFCVNVKESLGLMVIRERRMEINVNS